MTSVLRTQYSELLFLFTQYSALLFLFTHHFALLITHHFFDHPRPTANRIIASSLQPDRSSTPVRRPSCITATRSLTPRISSMSLLIIMIATPLSASPRINS